MVSERIKTLETRSVLRNDSSEFEYLTAAEIDDIFEEFAQNVHFLRVGHQRHLIASERQHIFMVTILLLTGARLSEAIMLKTSNFNFTGRRFPAVEIPTLKDPDGVMPLRRVPMSPMLEYTIREYLEDNKFKPGSTDPIFTFDERWYRYKINGIGKRVGVPDLHPHMFRHTFATWAMLAMVPANVLQRWLGHRSLSSTGVYTRITNASGQIISNEWRNEFSAMLSRFYSGRTPQHTEEQ